MATQVVELEGSANRKRMQYVQGCVEAYHRWRDAGKCPVDVGTQLSKLFPKTQGVIEMEDEDPDALALVFWDKTENGGGLLNYDFVVNWWKNIIRTAQQFLSIYTRRTIYVPNGNGKREKVTVATTRYLPPEIRDPGKSRFSLVKISNANPDQWEAIWDKMTATVKRSVRVIKVMGANRTFVQRKLRELEAEILEVFDEEN